MEIAIRQDFRKTLKATLIVLWVGWGGTKTAVVDLQLYHELHPGMAEGSGGIPI